MFDELGIMMIMMYPIIPLFLIQLHFGINFWRRLGIWTYVIIFLEWLPIGILLYAIQGPLLYYQTTLGLPSLALGVVLILLGVALHGWTMKLIGLKATIGYTELKPDIQTNKQQLITSGPFAVVRHPSYWAHIAIDVGLYLITGIVVIGLIAIIDLAIIYFVVINLEDRELVSRFGESYREYQRRVPKFFPKLK